MQVKLRKSVQFQDQSYLMFSKMNGQAVTVFNCNSSALLLMKRKSTEAKRQLDHDHY